MKKVLAVLLTGIAFVACTNEADRTGNVTDTAKVSPPQEKLQDSTSLTDTSYRIGDSIK